MSFTGSVGFGRWLVWNGINNFFVKIPDLLQSFAVHTSFIGELLNTFIDTIFEIVNSVRWFSGEASRCVLLRLIDSFSFGRFCSCILIEFTGIRRLVVVETVVRSHSYLCILILTSINFNPFQIRQLFLSGNHFLSITRLSSAAIKL